MFYQIFEPTNLTISYQLLAEFYCQTFPGYWEGLVLYCFRIR